MKISSYKKFSKKIDELFASIQKTINEAITYDDADADEVDEIKSNLIADCMSLNSQINEDMGDLMDD